MKAMSDPSFALLLATLRWPRTDNVRTAVESAAAQRIDWRRFLALANRHRVAPLALDTLLWTNLPLPGNVARAADESARRTVFAEMAMASELTRLHGALAAAAIATTALKGPALSIRAFGRFGLRTYRDLDLLVDADAVDDALRLLSSLGFRLLDPGATSPEWRELNKDAALSSPGGDLLVELHWRLFDNRYVMPAAATMTCNAAPLSGISLLADADELEFVTHHGAEHGWSRLKWLADVQGLLATYRDKLAPPLSVATAQAMILCRDLLGWAPPLELEDILAGAIRARLLAALARSEIVRSGERELEAIRFGSTIKNLSHYALVGGWRYWMEEARFDLLAPPRDADRRPGLRHRLLARPSRRQTNADL